LNLIRGLDQLRRTRYERMDVRCQEPSFCGTDSWTLASKIDFRKRFCQPFIPHLRGDRAPRSKLHLRPPADATPTRSRSLKARLSAVVKFS
jgi:hypothetical protein